MIDFDIRDGEDTPFRQQKHHILIKIGTNEAHIQPVPTQTD